MASPSRSVKKSHAYYLSVSSVNQLTEVAQRLSEAHGIEVSASAILDAWLADALADYRDREGEYLERGLGRARRSKQPAGQLASPRASHLTADLEQLAIEVGGDNHE